MGHTAAPSRLGGGSRSGVLGCWCAGLRGAASANTQCVRRRAVTDTCPLAQMHDMRRLLTSSTTTATDAREIRDAATTYYKRLFEDFTPENIKGTQYIDDICARQWDLSEWDKVTVNDEDIMSMQHAEEQNVRARQIGYGSLGRRDSGGPPPSGTFGLGYKSAHRKCTCATRPRRRKSAHERASQGSATRTPQLTASTPHHMHIGTPNTTHAHITNTHTHARTRHEQTAPSTETGQRGAHNAHIHPHTLGMQDGAFPAHATIRRGGQTGRKRTRPATRQRRRRRRLKHDDERHDRPDAGRRRRRRSPRSSTRHERTTVKPRAQGE